MSKPIHTSGPLIVSGGTIQSDSPARFIAVVGAPSDRGHEDLANARLLSASYNAFDTAAQRLGLNAVEFAERMADNGITELVDALQAAHREIRAWRDGINIRSLTMHDAKVGTTYASESAILDILAKMKGDSA